MTSCCGPAEYDGKGTNIPPGCNFANAVIRGRLKLKTIVQRCMVIYTQIGFCF